MRRNRDGLADASPNDQPMVVLIDLAQVNRIEPNLTPRARWEVLREYGEKATVIALSRQQVRKRGFQLLAKQTGRYAHLERDIDTGLYFEKILPLWESPPDIIPSLEWIRQTAVRYRELSLLLHQERLHSPDDPSWADRAAHRFHERGLKGVEKTVGRNSLLLPPGTPFVQISELEVCSTHT